MTTGSRFLPIAEPDLGPVEERFLLDAFRSGWISSIGSYIDRFEMHFAEFCEADAAVALSNGTAALHVGLVAAGVGPGDEVIVPALTFVATAAAVRHTGAAPVFVDNEPEIGTMDPRAVEHAITARTKAIIPVHLYGHPADMDPIMEIARGRGIVVIEDAAEAHGAKYKGSRVGSLGDMATFSFYGNKIITTGEGGMVTTNNRALADRIRLLKDHAMNRHRRYWHDEVGYNYRITNLQAAVGCAQLSRIGELMKKRSHLLATYRRLLRSQSVIVNPTRSWAEAVPWLVCIEITGAARTLRDSLIQSLRAQDIDSRPYFEVISEMPPYCDAKRFSTDGSSDLKEAAKLSAEGMSLPSSTRLSDDDVARVCGAVAAELEKHGASTETR